jgi:hypothetical protein
MKLNREALFDIVRSLTNERGNPTAQKFGHNFQKISEEITQEELEREISIGVCIDPTLDILQRFRGLELDILISYSTPTIEGERYTREHNFEGIAIGEAYDVHSRGTVGSLAKLLRLEQRKVLRVTEPHNYSQKVQPVVAGVVGTKTERREGAESDDLGIYMCSLWKHINTNYFLNCIQRRKLS